MSDRLKAILLLMGAMAAFTVLDTSAKFVSQHLPVFVAVFFRYALALLFAVLIVWRAGGLPLFVTRHPVLQVTRGALLLASTTANFIAMSYLQLAQTAAINFTLPLWVCALSVPLLGEHVGWRRWLAVLAGFCGVLVIMRPGSAEFHWAMLISLFNALLGALYNITTRKVGGKDSTETSLFYVGLVGTLGCRDAAADLGHAARIAVDPAAAHGPVRHARPLHADQGHRLAPASAIAPFIYTQIITMTMAGALVFHQFPDGWTLVGAVIVIASGVYVFARERRMGVTTAQDATPED